MANSVESFMSGDGTWTGSAVGKDGQINPNFIFAWPSDWIGTVDQASPEWTWQSQQWSESSVLNALKTKYSELYDTLNMRVNAIENAQYQLFLDEQGKVQLEQDAKIITSLRAIGGFNAEKYLSETLSLHISDRDYYSIPAWNLDLARRINNTGGKAHVFIYEGNTHGLKVSEHRWFSPAGTVAGKPYALERDLRLFRGEDPEAILYP